MSLDCKVNVVINYNGYNSVTIMPNPKTAIQLYIKGNDYVKDNNSKFYTADNSYNGKDFSYWIVTELKTNRIISVSFYKDFTMLINCDCIIKAVYGSDVKEFALIGYPTYKREKTTDSDKLWTYFSLQYATNERNLIRDDTSGNKYQTGLIIELGQYKVLGTNEDGTVNTDYSKITYESDIEQVKTATTTENGKVTNYSYNDDTTDKRKLYNFRATNTNYNNMNRLYYAVYFTNTPTYQMYVMKAYYYVIVDGKTILSDPVYFNFYKIGSTG
jgi:hypothetical protein